MLTKIFVLLYACFIFWQPAIAHAETPPRISMGSAAGSLGGLSVNAEYTEMTRESGRQVIELRGHVQIIFETQYITCDRAVIRQDTQEIEAIGNLVISSPQAYVEGDSAILSYKDNTGVIINGFVKSGQVIFEGKVVRKTGANTYEAEDAQYTACTTCPTAWTFSGSNIKAEIGGYAYIKNSVLRIARFPIFWLPYLIVPLKSERQTGLLVPQFDYSATGGTGISSSFFWAIAPNQDATITAKHYSLRGEKGILNYRYVLTEASEGELTTGYIHDRVFSGAPELLGREVGSRSNRWFLTYNHSYELPDEITQKIKLAFASDLRYPHDFPLELPGRGDPALENRISLTKSTERTSASIDASYYINMLNSNPLADNADSVHRLPEIRYSILDRPVADDTVLSNLYFNMSFKYVNFARDGFAFDRRNIATGNYSTPGGVFQPSTLTSTDTVRTGQRIDIQPELSYPFRVGEIDFLPAVQFRHMQYSLDVSPDPAEPFETSPYRQFVRASMAARTKFSKIYGDRSYEAQQPKAKITNWVDAESRESLDEIPVVRAPERPNLYRHEIEPEISLAGIPYNYQTPFSQFFGKSSDAPAFQDDLPLSDLDLSPDGRGVQFDYEDRLISRNSVTFALTNRLVRKTWASGSPVYKQIVSWKVGQSYDFDEAHRAPGRPTFPWSDISSLLDVRLDHFETNTLIRHFPYHNKTNTSTRIKVMDGNRFLQMNFKQAYAITQKVEEAYDGREENLSFIAGFDMRYLVFAGSINYIPLGWDPIDLRVKSHSVILNFKPPGNCWGILASITKPIDRSPEFSIGFDYQFGGGTGSNDL
jgi:LPS-assembly protein